MSAPPSLAISATLIVDEEQHKFTLFTKLPTELRLKIWNAALPAPRVIILSHEHVKGEYYTVNQASLSPKSKRPVIPYVNQESREVAAKRYKLCFGDYLGGRPIYFESAHDTLLFTSYWYFLRFHAFTSTLFQHESFEGHVAWALPADFGELNLKHIIFAFGPSPVSQRFFALLGSHKNLQSVMFERENTLGEIEDVEEHIKKWLGTTTLDSSPLRAKRVLDVGTLPAATIQDLINADRA